VDELAKAVLHASRLNVSTVGDVRWSSYLPLGLDRLGEELHVLQLGGGAEGLHALGRPEENLQQLRVQGPQRLLEGTMGPFY